MENFDELLNKGKQHNPTALMGIYSLFHHDVFNSCFRILNDKEEAEEVMQDSFLKAFSLLYKFEGDRKSLNAFIQRIAVNKSIDIVRKKKVNMFVSIDQSEIDLPDVVTEVDEEEVKIETVKETMNKMPEGYRLVLNLHLLEDMDFSEIAKTLHIVPSTVRSQFVRAKAKLIEMLNSKNSKL